MEWIISIFSSILSLLSLLFQQRQGRKKVVLTVEETYPGEAKEEIVGYEDKHYPKPIKRIVRTPGKTVRRKYLIEDRPKRPWGKKRVNPFNLKG